MSAKLESPKELQAVFDLIENFNPTAIHSVYASSQSAKTLLALNLAYLYSHRTGKNVLGYDTEGGLDEFVKRWDTILRKRYPNAKKIFVRLKRNWKLILADHGKDCEMRKSEKTGKTDIAVMSEKDIGSSELSKFITANNVGFIFYDSISAPIKGLGSGAENFPARASIAQIWLSSMQDMIDFHNIIVWCNHHSSKNPTAPFQPETMYGGSPMHYWSKVQIYIKRFLTPTGTPVKGAENFRRLYLMRFFDLEPKTKESLFKITDNGIVDTTEEELAKSRANSREE